MSQPSVCDVDVHFDFLQFTLICKVCLHLLFRYNLDANQETTRDCLSHLSNLNEKLPLLIVITMSLLLILKPFFMAAVIENHFDLAFLVFAVGLFDDAW